MRAQHRRVRMVDHETGGARRREGRCLARGHDEDEHDLFGGFEGGWCDPSSYKWRKVGPRKFCLDMGGFAFDAALLMRVEGAPWRYSGHGGESELVERLLPNSSAEDLQPLANCVSHR